MHVDDVAVKVDRHQVGRRDFLEAEAIGIDEEAVLPARKPGGDVGVDAVVETEPVDQPVESGLPLPAMPLRCCGLRWSFPPKSIFNFFSLRAAQHLGKIKVSTIDD